MRSSMVIAAACSAFAIAGCGGGSSSSSTASTASTATGVQGPSEIAAEPVGSAGDNPFTPAVGKDKKGVKPPKQAVSTGGPVAYKGSLPGLYGGTMDYTTCDADQLVTFLEQTPAKASAWASALGITSTEIRDYVSGLTAVTLRTDTRVTNHGYVNGVANPIQSVLQAGTAVFVNKYGQPVVKCYCGNPLSAPLTYTTPTYTGPVWRGFAPNHITIIQQSTTIINVFKLYDPDTDTIFARPAGGDGGDDRPYHGPGGTPAPAPTVTTPPVETTAVPPPVQTTEAPPTTAAESPAASFSPNPGHPGDTFVLSASGFAPHADVDFVLTRPDGVSETYTINIGADGSGSYTFPADPSVLTGTYHAVLTNPNTGASTAANVLVT